MTTAAVPADVEAAPVSRVLVVDDDQGINRLLRVRLAARGYQVEGAANGEEALACIERQPPDLIFLDVSMPGVGGLEVLEQVRAGGLEMAVVMTTAFGTEQVAIDALRRGADDYLRKPFEPAEFQAVLDRTVERLTLSRQNAALRRQLDEKRRQLETELAQAARVQSELLPLTAPLVAGYDVAARCVPAREVGGDFYDWQEPGSGLLTLTVGDVMGKGMPAALMMATVRAAMRAVVRHSAPGQAMRYVAAALSGDLDRADGFVTLFLAQLDVASGRLAYVDAGHGYVFLRRADGSVQSLPGRGLPLGIASEAGYEEGTLTMAPGDTLVVYSDGLVDAQPDMAADPMVLAGLLDGATGAVEMAGRLVQAAITAGPPPDDLTVLILYRRPS